MKLRDTFKMDHLWVVSSLPTDDGSVVLLNFTSRRPGGDDNCIIMPGEHKFVRTETVIAYEKARLISPPDQARVIASPGICPPHDPVSEDLLKRIQNGALVSDLTPQKIQKIIRASMGKQAELK